MDEVDLAGDIPEQQCEDCQRVLPLTKKYFAKAPGCTYKFQRCCRKCKKQRIRKAHLEKIEATAVESFCSRSISGGVNIPHTAEMLEALMNYFGGVNGFASIAMKQYWDAKPGSRMRSGILEMIVRLTSKNTEAGGARKPIDLYSEEELEEEIEKRISNAILLAQGTRLVNVIPQAPAGTFSAAPANDQLPVGLSDRRTQELAERAFREANGGLEALLANPEAVGVPPRPGE